MKSHDDATRNEMMKEMMDEIISSDDETKGRMKVEHQNEIYKIGQKS